MKKITSLLTALAVSVGLATGVYAENTEEVIVVADFTVVTVPNNASAGESLTDADKQTYTAAGEYLLTLTPALGSEWNVLGLARSGAITEDFENTYYTSVADAVKEKEGVVGKSAADYARVIIGLTSIGKNAENIEGYNLVEMLTKEAIEKQGLNGAVYALFAFDSGDYKSEVNREWLVETVLANELANGGWTFWGTEPDPDMTSMAITALAPYYNTNDEVKVSIDKALAWLSETQCESGAYASYGSENPESTSQVLVALTALGIDVDNDERFVKNGNTIVEAINEYAVDGGGFAHEKGGAVNLMATQQSYYALTSYYRTKDGKTSLYDMSDLAADISVTAAENTIIYKNNGNADAVAVSIMASYDENGRLKNTQIKDALICSGEEYITDKTQGTAVYLWNGMKPLCEAIRN